jgi:type IV pilus assembly protein PilV
MNHRKSQGGATLVEVLVAVLVLSIGLLGIAGLQLSALQNNRNAHVRSQASMLAYYIADRMRANRTVALTGGYDVDFGETPAGVTLNELDLRNWKTELANTLPSGDGEITLTTVGTNVVARIRVRWTTRVGDSATGTSVSITDTFDTRTQI